MSISDIKTFCKFLEHPDKTNITSNFGIIQLAIDETQPIFKNINWIFTIDRSGSMNDICEDGKTKMQHIHHTFKNMIDYLLKLSNIKQTITIIIFDNLTEIICYKSIIDIHLKNELDNILNKIIPRGMTNIENALLTVKDIIQKINLEETNITQTAHIFMTDGEITNGEVDNNILKNLLIDTCSNIFIGYGCNHSNILLKSLSNSHRGEYFFVESLENAGMIYGEILYNTIYEYGMELEISIENGEIYDYSDNQWKNKLKVNTIVSGKTRTWHIIQDMYKDLHNDVNLYKFKINLSYYNSNTLKKYNIELSNESDFEYPEKYTIAKDIKKYHWRHKTQEIMYEVQEHLNNSNNNDDNYNKKTHQYNEILNDFINNLKEYIKLNKLDNDLFMKNISDDIYITIKSLHSKYGNLFLTARSLSSCKERAYNIRNIDVLNNLNHDDDNYTLSDTNLTPYASLSTLSVMRSISCPNIILKST